MKKILFVLSIIGVLHSCSEDKHTNFTVKGKVNGMRKGIVYLQKNIDGKLVSIDSIFLKGVNNFMFSGNIENPEVYFITTSRRNSSSLPIFIEKTTVEIEADMDDLLLASISGSKNQELLDQFNQIIGRFNNVKNELYVKGLKASNNNPKYTKEQIPYQRIKKDKIYTEFCCN